MTADVQQVLVPSRVVKLPPTPKDWHDYGYCVQADGSLALLRTSADIRYRVANSVKEQEKTGRYDYPQLWPCDLMVSLFNGKRESEPFIVRAHGPPTAGRMTDGRWLVAMWGPQDAARTGGWLYDQRGRELGRFPLGYALGHLRCAADGTVWAGYVDQGVYAGRNDDGSWPVSTGGVVRFSSSGDVLWSMNADEASPVECDDCYALCIDRAGKAWTCTYTDLPIACIDEGAMRHWHNSQSGIDALATDGKHALLAGGYGSGKCQIALVRFAPKTAVRIAEWTFDLPSSSRASCVEGWGDTLHVVGDGQWRQYRVHDAVADVASGLR